MKSLLATACTLSLLLAAADQAQAGPREGFTAITAGTAGIKTNRAFYGTKPVVRDHRQNPQRWCYRVHGYYFRCVPQWQWGG